MAVPQYRQTERLAPVTGVKQQAPSVGYGDGVGEAVARTGGAMAGYARELDAYNARVDEAGAMELEAKFGEAARQIESGYLTTAGRNAIDQRRDADEAWDKLASEYSGLASNDRQRAMMQRLLDRRRERWASQRDNHLVRQTEVWQTQTEDASLAMLSKDAALLPVGSAERSQAYIALGQRLTDVGARRGWGPEQRAATGFSMFSEIHVATVGQLRDADPEAALAYLEEHRDQIDPSKLPSLLTATRDDAYGAMATREARELLAGMPPVEELVTETGEAQQVLPPVSASMGSRYGPRNGRMHRGVDYPVPVGTPVRASLSGVARIRNDPDGYGSYVEIDHGNGTSTRYAHLSGVGVRDGQRVEQGQAIALSGGAEGAAGAGNSRGPHVHYEFIRDGEQVDPATVVGGAAAPGARPGGSQFITREQALAWAAERAGGDPRKLEHYERAALGALERVRGVRADAESEAARQADEWRAANPGAPWSSAPAAIRSSVSPSYRATMAEREQNALEAEGRDEDLLQRNTRYLALLDEAAADPRAFLSRDLDDYRGILTESQYASLREERRSLVTAGPDGPTVAQQLSAVNGIVDTYARQVGIETSAERRKPEDAARLAHVRQYLGDFARQYQARTGQPPSIDELQGALRVAVTSARNAEGERVPLASDPRAVVEVPGDARRRIVTELRQGGIRNPTDAQIRTAYLTLLRRGELEPRRNRF